MEEADGRQPSALLRVSRERPRGRPAADKCDEVPPPHGAYPKAKDHGLSIAGLGASSVPCIAAKAAAQCPLRVRSGMSSLRPCPLYPSKRTLRACLDMSAQCRGHFRPLMRDMEARDFTECSEPRSQALSYTVLCDGHGDC